MAKYKFGVTADGDLIVGKKRLITALIASNYKKMIPSFNWKEDLLKVSNKLFRKATIEATVGKDDDSYYVGGYLTFCKEKFEKYFGKKTDILYIKVLKNKKHVPSISK